VLLVPHLDHADGVGADGRAGAQPRPDHAAELAARQADALELLPAAGDAVALLHRLLPAARQLLLQRRHMRGGG
jgi:hypothetical protein